MSPAIGRIREALQSADAAIWDKRYGKGLSIEYARAVHGEITDALSALSSLDNPGPEHSECPCEFCQEDL